MSDEPLSDEPQSQAPTPPGTTGGMPRLYPIAAWFYLALAVAGLAGLSAQRGVLDLRLLVDPGSWWIDIAGGLAIGGALLGLWAVMVRYIAAARRLEHQLRRLLGPIARGEALALAFISAVAEELVFRGALQNWLGWPAAAALFALAHAGPGTALRWWTAWAFAGGLMLGGWTAGRGTLLGAMLAHFLINAIQLGRFARAQEAGRPQAEPAAGEG